ncbi:hypothetical protein HK405_006663 [Cladochytrium tenue]|nr:hypothetical protein HK405_006663 [Cladochytrium tenue]
MACQPTTVVVKSVAAVEVAAVAVTAETSATPEAPLAVAPVAPARSAASLTVAGADGGDDARLVLRRERRRAMVRLCTQAGGVGLARWGGADCGDDVDAAAAADAAGRRAGAAHDRDMAAARAELVASRRERRSLQLKLDAAVDEREVWLRREVDYLKR